MPSIDPTVAHMRTDAYGRLICFEEYGRLAHVPAKQPVEIPDSVFEGIPSEDFCPHFRNGVMPGSVRAGQALTLVVDTRPSGLQAADGESVSSLFLMAEAESSEFSVAGAEPGCKKGASGSETEGG